jgi:hypothetical protein
MITITSTQPGFSYTTDNGTIAVFSEPSTPDQVSLHSTPTEVPDTKRISWPGEYDFSGTAITGISHQDDDVVSYVLQSEQVVCGFLVDPLVDVSNENLERLGTIDVLIITAAPGKLVQKIVDEIDPRIVIVQLGSNAEHNAETLKTVGGEGIEHSDKYKVKTLPADGREVVVFSN